MDAHRRRARIINMRKGRPLPHRRRTDGDEQPPTPCTATAPHADGGTYNCNRTTHTSGAHFDEARSVHWLPDDDTTEGAR